GNASAGAMVIAGSAMRGRAFGSELSRRWDVSLKSRHGERVRSLIGPAELGLDRIAIMVVYAVEACFRCCGQSRGSHRQRARATLVAPPPSRESDRPNPTS